MAVTIVRPDGTGTGASNWTITGGSPTIQAALNDNSDATYIRKTNSLTGTYQLTVSVADTTILATQQVKRVRVRVRASTPTTSGKIDFALGTRLAGVNYFHSATAIRGQYASAQEFVGPWFSSAPDGQSWDQDRVNGLRALLTEYRDTTDRGFFYEVYIDVDVAAQPSVTVTSPSGTLTTTATPDVAWTYTDTDNEAQAYYQIKVFTAAQYGAGGFDAETSTATWDSGVVGSSDASGTVSQLLLTGTYRAYVKAAKDINGQPFWSAWAFSGFVLNLTPPSVPTLSVAWDSALGKATLTITGSAIGAPYTRQYFQAERSDDGGTTYTTIRGGTEITPTGTAATAFDYEAPRDLTVRYRVRSVGVAGEDRIPSAYSVVSQVLVTNDGTWWLKAIGDPTLNVGGLRVAPSLAISVEEPVTVFRPLGRALPVVVSGLIGGYDGSYRISIVGDEWDDIEGVLLHQGTLLVQEPTGVQKYIRVTGRQMSQDWQGSRSLRTVQVDYVEVEG